MRERAARSRRGGAAEFDFLLGQTGAPGRLAAMMGLTSHYMRVSTRRALLAASAGLLAGCATRRVSMAPRGLAADWRSSR